jgi:hypothetical protein
LGILLALFHHRIMGILPTKEFLPDPLDILSGLVYNYADGQK